MNPDLKCSITCNWKEVKNAIAGLGHRLVDLNVFGPLGPYMAELRVAAAKCSNLCEFRYHVAGEEDMASLKAVLHLVKGSLLRLEGSIAGHIQCKQL